MAVNRTTAKDLGLWEPDASEDNEREAFLALAQDEAVGIAWGVRVFADKLRRAQGNLELAVRLYNGSGPRAEAYRERVFAFVVQTWGDSDAA